MAKALLLNALQDALSDYVVGLSPERLKVGVWSGKIVLEELQVNPEAVNQLRLPVNIIHGTVKKLEVEIPWTKLGSRPVKVHLEGVCVLVGPVDRNSWGDDEVRERRLGIKRASLEKAEAAAAKKDGNGNDEDVQKGFVEKLVQRIVDNIEINVADIHIRYEDTVLVPGQTVSAGVCLESFVVATTDKDFVPQFIDRIGNDRWKTRVHKLARVTGFSVYWRVNDKERYELIPPVLRSAALRRFVSEQAKTPPGDNGGGLERGDLIRPIGAVLKFVHCEHAEDKTGPKFEASFEMDDVKMDFRAEQYEQALSLKDSIAALANWQIFFPYRPKTTPRQDPKAWWRYAFMCVGGKPNDWANVNKVITARKEYVFLYEKVAADTKEASSKKLTTPLTRQQQRRLDELEEDLPLQTIVMFRTMARREIQRKRDAARARLSPEELAELQKKKSGGGGWWGSFWGSASSKKEEGDLALQDLTASFGGDAADDKVPPDYLHVRFTVQPHGSIRLYGRRDLPLVEARMVASATAELREDSSMVFSFSLSQLDVLDLFTQGAVFPQMLKVGGHEIGAGSNTPELTNARAKVAAAVAAGAVGAIRMGQPGRLVRQGQERDAPLACLNVALTKNTLKVDVCALSTDVAYNREVVDAVLRVFSARPAEAKEAMSNASKGLEAAQQKTKEELLGLSVSVSLDVAAPRVVVPISSSRDDGFLLLDMGHMLVEGGSVEGGAMEYRGEFSDMNARLPAKKNELLVRRNMDAVIEPFRVKAHARVAGGVSEPGVVLAMEVMPGVKGVISTEKIRDLYQVLDYVTKADLRTFLGLGASDRGSNGVERMGGDERLVAIGLGNADVPGQSEPLVLWEWRLKVPAIGLLLVELDKDAVNNDNGLLAEAAGMQMSVKSTRKDMVVQLHLDAVTVQDMARPNDSPFRYMVHSTPDETSHGGLIHVTYWASAGGVRRVPPAAIADMNQTKFDMVLDARISTLQTALDKESVVKATPFYQAVMRQDGSQHNQAMAATAADGGVGLRNTEGRMDVDYRSVRSAGSRVADAAKRMATNGPRPKAILLQASLTSVLFELVRSNPWETVVRAGISGLKASFSLNEGGGDGTKTRVTLADIIVTDVRPEAKGNPFRVFLAPLATSQKGEPVPTDQQAGAEESTNSMFSASRAGGSSSSSVFGVGQVGGAVRRGPLIAVTATTSGSRGSLDAEVHLASFACNVMVDAIRDSLLALIEVNIALLKMLGAIDSGTCGARKLDGAGGDPLSVLGGLEEKQEPRSEIAAMRNSSAGWGQDHDIGQAFGFPAPADVSGVRHGSGRAGRREERNGPKPFASWPPIRARLVLDDGRINLIEEPSKASSRVVVLRASWEATFTRSVTSEQGGDSTEDIFHLSCLRSEYLVDAPAFGGGSGRKISQVLEPFTSEFSATLLSSKGSLRSAKFNVMVEAVQTRLSYTDMMLFKRIADRANAAYEKMSSVLPNNNDDDDGSETQSGAGSMVSFLPDTYQDTSRPWSGKKEAARVAAMKAATKAGVQPSTMAAVSFSASCSMARVVLVNDYEGQGVPVLRFSSRGLKAEGNGYKEDFSMEVSGVTEVEFFNVKVVRWEPLTEPWQPVLTASVGMDFKGRKTLQIKLACEDVIKFNVTSDFMESFLSTYWMLYSDGTAKDDPLALLSGGAAVGVDEEDIPEAGGPEVASSAADLASLWPEVSGPSQPGWAEGPMPLEGLNEGSVTLKNTTGLQLAVGTTDFPEKSLRLGALDTVRLPFETHRDPANAGQFDLRGKAAVVGWADEDMQRTREGLPPLKVDRAGVHVFPLLPTTPMPAGYVASAPVVVEVYQSQRYSMVTREWSAPYMVHDGPEFSTKDWRHAHPTDNRERPLDSIALPDERYWSWRDSWHVDFSKKVGTEIDEAGWEYRVDFASFNLINSSRTRRDLDQARRRKWIRTRAPKPLPMNDPFRPLHLAWQIDVTPQGRLEATIRSTVQLTNSTGLPLEVRALCSAWPPTEDFSEGPGRRSLGSVAPGCTLDVPVKMVYASHLQLRPVSLSSSSSAAFASIAIGGSVGGEASAEEKPFEWSAPLPLLSNNVDTSRDDWVSCRQVVGGGSAGQARTMATIRLVVHAKTTGEGCVVMTVLPPVTVVNALPCPLSFRAFLPPASAAEVARRDSLSRSLAPPAPDSAAKPTATLLEVGRIPTADTAYLHTLEVGDGAKFSIKIEHHGWSAALMLLPPTREDLRAGRWAKRGVTFKVPCLTDDGSGGGGGARGTGGFLEIRCLFEPRVGPSCPALRLHLFCTHWLVDRSGLGLGFGVSDNRRLAVPRVRHNAASTTAGAEGGGAPLQVHVAPVEQLSCTSTRSVVVSTATIGGLLYTDRGFVFMKDSLPRAFRGATMIRTACSDKNDGSQHFLRFRVVEASTVHVLFDRHCPCPPTWLTSAFRLTTTRVHVSNKGYKGGVAEGAFVVWSRDAPAGSWVGLGGNRARGADTMYLVVVTEQAIAVPVTAVASSASSAFKRTISSREDLMESWTLGTEGLSLCNSPEERVRVAVPEGAGRGSGGGGVYGQDGFGGYTRDVWSAELHVPGGASGVFQVQGTQGEVYELALRAEVCPGMFHRTTQVTVIPRYCVVNLLKDEIIWLKQPGAPESSAVCVPPGGRLPWHWMQGKNQSGVSVRTDTTSWSYGEVAIHRVGTTALHVPAVAKTEGPSGQTRGQAGGHANDMLDVFGSAPAGGTDGGAGGEPAGRGQREGEQTVVHVDVQLPDQPFVDEYSLLVVFWKANERFAPIYSASNASPVTVYLRQAGPDRDGRQPLSAKDVWKLEPGEQREIGWTYPAAQRSLIIHTGRGSHAVELSTDTAGNYAKIPTALASGSPALTPAAATDRSFIWASVLVKGATKVIHISARPPPGGGSGRRSSIGGGHHDNQQQGPPQHQQRSHLQYHQQQQQHQRQQQQRQQQQQQRYQQSNLEKEAASKRRQESEAPALELTVDMRGFGVSLIGPVNGRRQELIYAQVSDVHAKLSRDRLSSVQASIGSVQVDNHLPGAIFPVVASKRQEESPPHGDDRGNDGRNNHSGQAQRLETPFLQLSIIKEVNQATNTAHYDYVAFRMLEVDVMADRATLLHLLVWCKPLQGYLLMWREQLDSRAWVAKRTAEVLERGAQAVPGGSVDVEQVRRTARIQRKYVKTMQFHPIIVRLSYVNSAASDKLVAQAGMPIINKIPTIMKSRIDLASYLVEDTFGSVRDISKNVIAHYYVAGTTQVLSLVGSMRALGSPADLISNVGSGVKALVYAPAQGLVQGPSEFFEGVGRGAHSFVKGTVHGVLNSVAGVGGAVTDTVSKLSFDRDYQMKRELSKNKAMANQGGVGQGFAQGGKDIMGGFASGVSGIFTAPVSGAKKGGVGGFFKGVGKGLVGAVVKPAVGVTDSVLSVAQGISNSAINIHRQEHLRPRRALTKDSDTGRLVVVNYSTEAAEAQALVESGVDGKDKEGESKDKYESHTQVSDLTIIFANTRMILVKRTKNDRLGSAKMLKQSGAVKPLQMVSKAWEEVASVSVVGDSIVIGRYQGGNISLKAALAPRREELYRQFYVHRDKMGDPTSMRSPDEAFGTGHSGVAPPPLAMTMRAHSMAMQESLRGYTFGSAFGRQLQSHGFTDSQILDRAERQLQFVVSGDWKNVDNVTWELVHNWNTAHTGMNTTRCLCVVFVNASTSAVQFLEMRKRDGQGYRLMIGPLCDVDSQQLMPGGVAILFAWGHPSTNILKKGFVVMVAETTAFSAVFAVQREKVAMTSKSGFQAGFLEKNIQEWWSKQVVVIK